MTRRPLPMLSALALAALAGAAAWGVTPQNWTHRTLDDFKPGTFDNTVINNYGELLLGRAVTSIALDPEPGFVNAFTQTPDGAIYCATSSPGRIFKIAHDQATVVFTASPDFPQILALASDAQGHILAGVAGDHAQLLRLTLGADATLHSARLFADPAINYIWTILPQPDGSILLGTGPDGGIWQVDAQGHGQILAKTGATNVLSLLNTAQGIVAGTDSEGLVLRLDPHTHKPFVLFDAGDVDITALAQDPAGNIYVAAGSAQIRPTFNFEPPADISSKSKPGTVEPEAIEPGPPPDELAAGTQPAAAVPTPVMREKQPEIPPAPDATDISHAAHSADSGTASNTPAPGPAASQDAPAGAKASNHPLSTGLNQNSLLTPAKLTSDTAGSLTAPRRLSTRRAISRLAVQSRDTSEPDEGNAIYRITPDGSVTTVLKEDDTMLALAYQDNALLIGTGAAGRLWQFQPATRQQALIARVGSDNIVRLFRAADGTIYAGGGNVGRVYHMAAGDASSGTFTSAVLDADHTARFGLAKLTATVPPGATAVVQTRSGNVRDVDKNEEYWSDWSPAIPAGPGSNVTSPTARFMQYRIKLQAGAQHQTPTVEQIRIAYQVDNLPPHLTHVKAELSAGSPSDFARDKPDPTARKNTVRITWDASDPNDDHLVYRVLYREVGTQPWIQIEHNITDTFYSWDVLSVPDGQYQIKVIASDRPDNAPETALGVAQVTAPLTICSSLPTIADVKATVDGNRAAIHGTAHSSLLPIVQVAFQVDSGDWQPTAASDKIFDSPTEAFELRTYPLAAGAHRITLRAVDSQGNTRYSAVSIEIKPAG